MNVSKSSGPNSSHIGDVVEDQVGDVVLHNSPVSGGYAASPSTVAQWIAEGQRQGTDYLFLLKDSFSHDDYYEYSSIADFERTREKYSHQDVDMQWISQIIPISPAAVEHQKSIGEKRD